MNESVKKLTRSRSNRMFLGVCGGIGEYLNTDPTIVRLVAVCIAFFTVGTFILAYIIAALVIPENNTNS